MHPHPDLARMRSHDYSPVGRSPSDRENGVHPVQVHQERTGPVPVLGLASGADLALSYTTADSTPKREDKPPLIISTTSPAIPPPSTDELSTDSSHPNFPSSLDTADSDPSHALASPILMHPPQDDEHAALTSQSLNHDGTPKRPMNAFMIFARRRRPQVSAANQSMRTGEISKILSREWSTMHLRDKQFYLDQAKKLKDNFSSRYPDYVYKRRPNNSRKRRRANSLDSLSSSLRTGEENDSPPDMGEPSPPGGGHDSGSSIHSRGMGSPDHLVSPVHPLSDIGPYGSWPMRSVHHLPHPHHPHHPLGPHDPLVVDLSPSSAGHGQPPHHGMSLAYPGSGSERFSQLAWPPLSPLTSKAPGQQQTTHHLHHRASWGGVPSLAPISAEDLGAHGHGGEMDIDPMGHGHTLPHHLHHHSTAPWGSPGGHPMIPKLETIKLEPSAGTTPASGGVAADWYLPTMGPDHGSGGPGGYPHPPPSAGARGEVFNPLTGTTTGGTGTTTTGVPRPWSASGSSAESDSNTHSGSIHSARHSFDPAATSLAATAPGPGGGPPPGEYYPSPTSAHSSVYFAHHPPPLHPPPQLSGPEGVQGSLEGNGRCSSNPYEEDHPNPYHHSHSHSLPHTHTPPSSFGSGYIHPSHSHSRLGSFDHSSAGGGSSGLPLRRDSTSGLEPPFGMH